MAEAYHSAITRFTIPINSRPRSTFHKLPRITCSSFKSYASISSNRDDNSQKKKKSTTGRNNRKARRPLINLSTSSTNWKGDETAEYSFTLRQLHLADLAGEGEEDTEVLIRLSIQKHTGFGMSVDGRIVTSFTSSCSNCCSPYCREIDTTFSVCILSSSRTDLGVPEVGWSDPSVIYVKPGSEADLDSVIRETIHLTASAKGTCSDSCQESPIIWESKDEKRTYNMVWSRLLEIRDSLEQQQAH